MSIKLRGLTALEFIHSEDKGILDKLDSMPGLKKFLAETISVLREKFTAVEMMGDGINVTPEAYPELYSCLVTAAETLDVSDVPTFYMKWGYDIAMGTEGSKQPRISALSGAVDLLSEMEQTFLLGHELGHIMAGHKPYHNLLITFYTPLIKNVANAEVWLALLRPMLLQWYRLSDFTADRAGLLACQDFNAAITTMVKMAGIPKKYYGNITPEIFLRQAKRFEQNNKGFADNIIQNLSINTACVPWLVVRAAKLYEWYNSGEYVQLINRHNI